MQRMLPVSWDFPPVALTGLCRHTITGGTGHPWVADLGKPEVWTMGKEELTNSTSTR